MYIQTYKSIYNNLKESLCRVIVDKPWENYKILCRRILYSTSIEFADNSQTILTTFEKRYGGVGALLPSPYK